MKKQIVDSEEETQQTDVACSRAKSWKCNQSRKMLTLDDVKVIINHLFKGNFYENNN